MQGEKITEVFDDLSDAVLAAQRAEQHADDGRRAWVVRRDEKGGYCLIVGGVSPIGVYYDSSGIRH